MRQETCGWCKKQFKAQRVSAKWCSQGCASAAWRARQPAKPVRRLECKECGVGFETTDRRKAFCSPECNWRFQNRQRPADKKHPRECPLCGSTFQPMHERGVGKKYCSKLCQNRAKYLRYRAHAGKVKYNLEEGEYDALLAKQNGVCAICGEPETASGHKRKRRKLAVDHCHEHGMIRGLLCSRCNLAIGYMKDEPERLRTAAAYLEGFKA